MTLLWILLGIVALFFLITYICFLLVFYVPNRKEEELKKYTLPEGKIYEPFHDKMLCWMKEARNMVSQDVYVTSFDGLKLHGKYYEYAPGAPIELMFHGYRGTAERDLSGGVQRCFSLGRSTLIVDQRASAYSEGNVISFGINERKDCMVWIQYILEQIDADARIILTGISMGASTVMMAAGMELPKNVIMVLADCGYTSAQDIIRKVCRQIKLPDKLLYPIIRFGAKLYGRFDLEEYSPIEAMKTCKLPIIFLHGEADDYVPCEMSRQCYDACSSPKTLLTVPGAGHGLGYLVGRDAYYQTLLEFSNRNGLPTEITNP